MKVDKKLYDQLEILGHIARYGGFNESLDLIEKYMVQYEQCLAVATQMVESITDVINEARVVLPELNDDNWQSTLDDALNDGGEARCEYFIDLATDWALQFGGYRQQRIRRNPGFRRRSGA
jgi:hypothetical protein